jgi:hypothetical protein
MTAAKEDFLLLLKLDEVYGPGVPARKFAYSDQLADVVKAGTFFDTYPLDSDERFWVNELATYFEMLGTMWEEGVVEESLALEWGGAMFMWKLIGPILVQAREVFGSVRLWTAFEALATAQADL